MKTPHPKLPGGLGIAASALGLMFASVSTHDYAQLLDRQLHGMHCSFLPGLTAEESGANACTVALYSPYSALFREKYWGGIPIALFGVGAFAFFVAFSLFMLAASDSASKRTRQAFALSTLAPFGASIVMFTISATKLGEFCKVCMGMYFSSTLLLVAGVLAFMQTMGPAVATRGAKGGDEPGLGLAAGSFLAFPVVLFFLGLFTVSPAYAYSSSLPDYTGFLHSCPKLAQPTEQHNALLHLPTKQPVKPALEFLDPLCPTCKAVHQRLLDEGAYEHLDMTVSLLPLDSECNQMLDRPMHPGACIVSRAVICADASKRSRTVLEWAFDHQDELHEAGKKSGEAIKSKITARFPDLAACIDSREASRRLDQMLLFAVANHVAVSTPQLFLGNERICDEDTDLGLRYTLTQIAPEVLR